VYELCLCALACFFTFLLGIRIFPTTSLVVSASAIGFPERFVPYITQLIDVSNGTITALVAHSAADWRNIPPTLYSCSSTADFYITNNNASSSSYQTFYTVSKNQTPVIFGITLITLFELNCVRQNSNSIQIDEVMLNSNKCFMKKLDCRTCAVDRRAVLQWYNDLYQIFQARLVDNPLGNLISGRRPWAKLIRSASLQRVFDAAIAKLLCRLVSRCFYNYFDLCLFLRQRWTEANVLYFDKTVARWRHGNVFNCYVRYL